MQGIRVKKAVYTISTKSKSFKNKYKSKHKSSNRDYYVIRSYLERMEKTKGGTLALKAGTYQIKGILYIPSNVTIKLRNGVTLEKYKASGTNSLFHFVPPGKSYKKITKYNGTRNSRILGSGKAVIDLRYVKEGLRIAMGHNKNITVSGITFQNMYSRHFIEIDANQNSVVKNCSFINAKDSGANKEAVNLDIPDKNTRGFGVRWSAQDKTINQNITIQNCRFINVEREIGTHAYSTGKYFTGIRIIGNSFQSLAWDTVRATNWSGPVIQNNTFSFMNGSAPRVIYCTGVINPVISGNLFEDYKRAIEFNVFKNSKANPAYKYPRTNNTLSQGCLNTLKQNRFVDIQKCKGPV